MKIGLLTCMVCAALFGACDLKAQGGQVVYAPDSVWRGYRDARQREECRRADHVLATGHPASDRDAAMDIIGTCGPLGGTALARELVAVRNRAHPGAELDAVVNASRDFVDGTLFRTALALAVDRRAGRAARVTAVRVIYGMFEPGTISSYAFFANDSTAFRGAFMASPHFGTPLPKTAASETAAAMERVYRDTTQPRAVRNAAFKLMVVSHRLAR